MCGLVGVWGKFDPKLIRELILQASVRGLHATGIGWVQDGLVHMDRAPWPAATLLANYDLESLVDTDGLFKLVAHCRYSTSDREYNQPLGNKKEAIVHNGVVTQELYKNWESLYDQKTETKNDSELLLCHDPLKKWPNASIAMIHLTPHQLWFARNGKRPLWFLRNKENMLVASTQDIFVRSGLTGVKPCSMMSEYTFNEKYMMSLVKDTNLKDLQNA